MKKQPTKLQQKAELTWQQISSGASGGWKHFSKYTIKRRESWRQAKLFLGLWVCLIIVVIGAVVFQSFNLRSSYLQPVPASGGTWRGGMVGQIGNLNPLFAATNVDSAVDHLVFNGLLKYSDGNTIVNDLARSVDISQDGTVYTINLRKNVKWHDGQKFTASDVLYTIKVIQDPATNTALAGAWQNVKITAPDNYTVVATLPAPFAPFRSYLTIPILPAHILKHVQGSQLRNASFDTAPIGTGPFIFRSISNLQGRQEINFVRNDNYFAVKPKLQSIIIASYQSEDQIIKSLDNRYLTAAVLSSSQSHKDLNQKGLITTQAPLDKIALAFLNNSNTVLRRKGIRQALGYATNQASLLSATKINGQPISTPLLPSQLGYSSAFRLTPNLKKAKKLLESMNWKVGKSGIRTKHGKRLTFTLTTTSDPDYVNIAKALQAQWKQVGVELKVNSIEGGQFQQSVLSPHNYDILLYSLSVGSDSDEYAYWHSSQADPGGSNLSEYKNSYVDSLLDGGRTRLNEALRAQKYQAFMKQFANDVPAIPLYQLTYNYVLRQPATGVNLATQPEVSDRYDSVANWSQRTHLVRQTP